ncbi:uncharacterized protein LAJ45_10841 [Morchella importuna]|uniref:uncharacterized protein n=1 Tax=Morchella importuna TaxID=1174673 RepID=UPI001E8D4D99|nr:uncharacterized protein LAJ45_10841 [Morchella importuna]KAH8145177.1 hypothetical protein LAJ45_10841 [Morchella importuna]
MSSRRWNVLPPFSLTPSPHRPWRHPETVLDQPAPPADGDIDWADDDASSTVSRTPSSTAGPPRKKRKTRKHLFTRPKSSASTREPTWEPEEEDPDMLDSITVAGGFLIVGQGAIDPLPSSPPPPLQPKKRGPGRPPATPKTPGSNAKITKGKTKTTKKPTPSTSTRKGRSASNAAAKQVSPELGHPKSPSPPAKSPTTKRPALSFADRGRHGSPAPPCTATPSKLNAPHAQDDPISNPRNEIPSSVIDSDSGTQTPPNAPTPTSTDPAPPEPPPAPAPAWVTWPTALTPPPPNPHVNELAAHLTFNIHAFPTLNHLCYVLGQDLLPPRDERSSPLADIFPDAESPPRQEVKPCYERLRHVVGKEMGLLLPEAGAEQEWVIYVNYHFPVQNQEQLDVCMAHLVHHARPVHDIVLSKKSKPELFQAALEDVRSQDRDFWKGRRGQMAGVRTGVILLQRGVGMSRAKAKPRNKLKKKGKEKERKEPAGKKRVAEEEDVEMDMGREIRDSMEPSPAPTPTASAAVSLAPSIGTRLLRISPVRNASQESRLIEDDESTTRTATQMLSTKVQRIAAPPPTAPKDNEKENKSLQTPEGATNSTRLGKRKIGGHSSAASTSLANNRNESRWASTTKAETSSSKSKGKGKDVDMSNSKETTPVAGPARKRRKTRIKSPPRTPLIPDVSAAPEKAEVPEGPEVPIATDLPEEPEWSMAIDHTYDLEVSAETFVPDDPEHPPEIEPTEGERPPEQTQPPKEPPNEIQLSADIWPQPVPETSQTPPIPAASEVADSTASTETQGTPEAEQPTATATATATANTPAIELPQKEPPAIEALHAAAETTTPEIPVVSVQPEEPTPMEIEKPQEAAQEPPKASEKAAKQHSKTTENGKIPEPETAENKVTTTAEHLSQDVVDDVRVRARAQKLVTNEEVKEFHNLNNNRLIEAEAKEKGARAIKSGLEDGVKEEDEGKLQVKVVNNNEKPTAKEVVGDEAVIEEHGNKKEGGSSVKQLGGDAHAIPAKEPEVPNAVHGSLHDEPEETPAKETPIEQERQGTPQEGGQEVTTALNATVAADQTEGTPTVHVLPPPVAVEEPQDPISTPSAVVVDTSSVVVERAEDVPAKALDDSGNVTTVDPPARASTPPPPPPLETACTPMDTSSPYPNDEVDVIMTNNDDAGESSIQPTLPEQDLSAANTVSEQDPTVPMDIDDESRPPVNDGQALKGKGKEILDSAITPLEGQEPTVAGPAINDAEDEGSNPVPTYSQSVDIQHGASLLLWAAEVPAEELTSDAPALERSSPLPLTLPIPPISAPPASATAVQLAEEPQAPQQTDEVHEAIAVAPTTGVKRRSRAKNSAAKDTAKSSKETAKQKTSKAKPTGPRAAPKRTLIVSLKLPNAEHAQGEGTSHSRAEESHSDGAAVAASTTRTPPPPATPSNNWLPATIGFTPVNPPSSSSPLRASPSTPAPLPRPQPYRRPEPTNTPRSIAAKPGGVSPNPRSTSSAELLAAARKQTQTKSAKSKAAVPRVGSATTTPEYPNAPIPSPIASPGQSIGGRLITNARRSGQPSESTPSPNRPVVQQQQPQLAAAVAPPPPPVDEPTIQQTPVVATTAGSSQHVVVPRPVIVARNVSPLATDKGKEMQVHPVPEDSPAAHPAQATTPLPDALTPPAAVQVPQTPQNSSGRRLGSSKLREMQSNDDPSVTSGSPVVANPLPPAQRTDPQAPPTTTREQTPAASTTASSIAPDASPSTAERVMASTTRQSTPLSLPPARSTMTPEYIDSKKIQPLVPRDNFLYWEPSIGKVGPGADIKQPIGTLLRDAGSASVSPIHGSASGLAGFPTIPVSGRPLFQSPPPLRPLSPIRVSPSPPPQVPSPLQPKPQAQVDQQGKPQGKPQIQPQVQPQPQPQVQPQAQLQAPPQAQQQAQPDVQSAPPPPPGAPAQVSPANGSPAQDSPAIVTTKEMIFHISHCEGDDQKITLHGRDFLSPTGFNWNTFVSVLTQMISFNQRHEVLVVNLHHLVDDGESLDEGIPFYRKVNEVLIAKVDPLGRPPKDLWEKVKSERKKLRARFDE